MYDSFVALGDSFTEGLDDLRDDGSYRGWADLVAAELATRIPGFRYANLAVRGRRLRRIREEQLPMAEAMVPALVGMSAGGNDIIGFRCDVQQLAEGMHEILERLARTAQMVVVFTGFDPRGRLPMGRVLAARAETYNASIRASSAELGVHVVDLWTMTELYEPTMWAPDRLHLSGEGHALVARHVLDRLGLDRLGLDLPDEAALVGGPATGQPVARPAWLSARREDAAWFSTYFAPWVSRKLRGRSAGDFVEPKLPELTAFASAALADPGRVTSRVARSPRIGQRSAVGLPSAQQ